MTLPSPGSYDEPAFIAPADEAAPTEEPVATEKTTKPPATEKEEQTETGSGGVALIITAIIAVTIIAVAGITAFVILKLKGNSRK